MASCLLAYVGEWEDRTLILGHKISQANENDAPLMIPFHHWSSYGIKWRFRGIVVYSLENQSKG